MKVVGDPPGSASVLFSVCALLSIESRLNAGRVKMLRTRASLQPDSAGDPGADPARYAHVSNPFCSLGSDSGQVNIVCFVCLQVDSCLAGKPFE